MTAAFSYEQKMTLTAYELFFGNRYETSSDKKVRTAKHVEMQKMCYLLKVAGVEVGMFDFSWNIKGPFSPGLLALLHSIDKNDTLLRDFYQNTLEKDKLFSEELRNTISDLRDKLEIDTHKENQLNWVELLGSLTYISRAMLPGAGFDVVNKRLVLEKSKYRNVSNNRYAWEVLKKVKFLCEVGVF